MGVNPMIYGGANRLDGLFNINKPGFDFATKEGIATFLVFEMFSKTNDMFKWINLPETIPNRIIELQLQANGYTGIKEVNGELYALYGGLGGEPDYNYMPTIYTIANPYLKYSGSFRIGEEVVVIPNDSMYMGLFTVNSYYANQLAENRLSLKVLRVALRTMSVLTGKDVETCKAIDKMFDDLEKGKLKSIAAFDLLDDAVKSLPFTNGSSQTIIQLIEDQQYLRGTWWNELGIQSNYNMKRETITSNENMLNIDSLLPRIDNMLERRKLGCKQVNKMFGTNWDVELNSSWAKLRREISIAEHANLEKAKNGQEVIKEKKSNQLDKDGDNNDVSKDKE